MNAFFMSDNQKVINYIHDYNIIFRFALWMIFYVKTILFNLIAGIDNIRNRFIYIGSVTEDTHILCILKIFQIENNPKLFYLTVLSVT